MFYRVEGSLYLKSRGAYNAQSVAISIRGYAPVEVKPEHGGARSETTCS